MAVNVPYQTNAATVQGPGPTGQEGFPIAIVGATGASPIDVNIASGVATPETQEVILLPKGTVRTSTYISPDQINRFHRGVNIYLRITAAPVSPTGYLRISLQARDPADITTYLGLNARTSQVTVNGVGGFMWMFYPGSAGEVFVLNFSGMKDVISYPLPRTWRIVVVHSDAQSYTYSLSYTLMP